MYIGRVKGTVTSTIKHELFKGRKLLLVVRLNLDGSESKAYDIALDDVQAGVGDVVVVLDEGSSARQVIGKRGTGPARAIIIGIVDQVAVEPARAGRLKAEKQPVKAPVGQQRGRRTSKKQKANAS